MACACDALFPLPVEEKAIMVTWRVLAIPFPPCLSRKRPYRGLDVRLRWPIIPCMSRKSPFQVSPVSPQRGLERTPKVARELPIQKQLNFVLDLLLKQR